MVELLWHHVVVRLLPSDSEEKRVGSLVIPAGTKDEKSNLRRGVVVAAGRGGYRQAGGPFEPCPVVRGDIVVFNKYTADRFATDGLEAKNVVISQFDLWTKLTGYAEFEADRAQVLADTAAEFEAGSAALAA